MPNESPPLYEFYFRYKWSHTDFEGFQDAMVNVVRDAFGAVFGPSLIDGGAVAPSGSTRAVTVQPYIAINDDGYLNVQNDITLATVTANSSGNPRKDLIVARPKLTNGTMISRPTSPFDSVPLTILQETEVVVIAGTPAGSPAYPSKAAGDVIIAGLAVANGATSFSSGNIDTSVTELISTNANFSTWVVAKDANQTAAITAGAAAPRAALTLTGNNNQAGLEAIGGGTAPGIVADGPGNGTAVADIALRINQNIDFNGSNPDTSSPAESWVNVLTPLHFAKLWGAFQLNGSGGFTSQQTLNCTLGYNSGNLRVTILGDMADAGYAVIVGRMPLIVGAGAPYTWGVSNETTGQFDLILFDNTGTPVDLTTAGFNIKGSFVVFGNQ